MCVCILGIEPRAYHLSYTLSLFVFVLLFSFSLYFFDFVLDTGSLYIAQDGLDLTVLQLVPPKS